MKTLQKVVLTIALMTLIYSCQSNSNLKKELSSKETRKGIIDTIANNNEMSMEMMDAMMNSKNGKMMMQENEKMMRMMTENKDAMGKMMKNNPDMMKNMMLNMMESSKEDTSMMSGMCKTMMRNSQMMNMMQKRMGGNMGMNKMDGMDIKKEDSEK